MPYFLSMMHDQNRGTEVENLFPFIRFFRHKIKEESYGVICEQQLIMSAGKRAVTFPFCCDSHEKKTVNLL